MKKILLFALLIIAMAAQAQTFTIVNDLAAPQKHLPSYSGDDAVKAIMKQHQNTGVDIKCVANSLDQESLSMIGKDPFFQTFVRAFAEHRPIVLSPDMIWLNICQQFSHHVNQNAEALRDRLVYHEGKKEIEVRTEQDMLEPDADWNEVLDNFSEEIDQRTKGEIAKVMVSDFSTSGRCEHIASQITLMGAMKQYFNYSVVYLICGIPSITLEGTTVDWQRLLAKTEALAQYDLESWVSDLRPILKQFIKASKGKINYPFWQSMVMTMTPERLQSQSCGGGTTMLDGWFLKLFPYSLRGKTPEKVAYNTNQMLAEMEKVPFLYKDLVNNKEYKMEMWAGFVGVEEDTTTYALRPRIGWMILEAETTDPEILAVCSQLDPWLKVKEFPEVARKVGKLNHLTIEFSDGINIPDWIGEVQVENLYLWGKFDKALLNRLREMLPDRDVSTFYDNTIFIEKKRS